MPYGLRTECPFSYASGRAYANECSKSCELYRSGSGCALKSLGYIGATDSSIAKIADQLYCINLRLDAMAKTLREQRGAE